MEDNKNLTARSFKAVGLVLFFQMAAQVFQILLGIFLARLLCPDDYGIIGMLAIFWGVINVFIDGGFAQALLQSKRVTNVDYSSVFYYNFVLSILFCILMIFAAPQIAAFYKEDILIQTIRVTAWTLPITAIGAVPKVILGRGLNQGKISVSLLAGNIVSGIAALGLAYAGFGVWALVWQNFLAVTVSTLLVLLFVRWRPTAEFSLAILWKHFRYGSKLLASRILFTLFGYIYNVAIGRYESKEVLGYYEQGRRYAQKIPLTVQTAVDNVLFPAFSKIQDDDSRLRAAYSRALQVSVCAFVFCNLLIFVLCRPAVEVVLTEKWLPAVPFCRLLSLAIFFVPIQTLARNLLNSRGKSGTTLILNIISKAFVVLNVWVMLRWNLTTMLVTDIVFSWFCVALHSACVAKELEYSVRDQFRDTALYFVLAGLTCAVSWGCYQILWGWNKPVSLIAGTLLAPILYAVLNYVWGTPAWAELSRLVPWTKLRRRVSALCTYLIRRPGNLIKRRSKR